MTGVERVLPVANQLGEGPLWHPGEGALYWVDIEGSCFHRFFPETEDFETFQVDQPVGCLAFRNGGGLVFALRDGIGYWDMDTLELEMIVSPESGRSNARFNDGRVDKQGRFWAGTLGEDDQSCLYRLDPDGSLQIM